MNRQAIAGRKKRDNADIARCLVRGAEESLLHVVTVFTNPRTLYVSVTSRASTTLIGGRMKGGVQASIVLPEPGGPKCRAHDLPIA